MKPTNVVPLTPGGKTVEEEYGSKFDSNNSFCQTDIYVQG